MGAVLSMSKMLDEDISSEKMEVIPFGLVSGLVSTLFIIPKICFRERLVSLPGHLASSSLVFKHAVGRGVLLSLALHQPGVVTT